MWGLFGTQHLSTLVINGWTVPWTLNSITGCVSLNDLNVHSLGFSMFSIDVLYDLALHCYILLLSHALACQKDNTSWNPTQVFCLDKFMYICLPSLKLKAALFIINNNNIVCLKLWWLVINGKSWNFVIGCALPYSNQLLHFKSWIIVNLWWAF